MWVVELVYGIPIPTRKVQVEQQALMATDREGGHVLGLKSHTQVC